jgi:hypothetical protein
MSFAPENPKQTPSPEREPRWEMPVPPETVRYPPPLWQYGWVDVPCFRHYIRVTFHACVVNA